MRQRSGTSWLKSHVVLLCCCVVPLVVAVVVNQQDPTGSRKLHRLIVIFFFLSSSRSLSPLIVKSRRGAEVALIHPSCQRAKENKLFSFTLSFLPAVLFFSRLRVFDGSLLHARHASFTQFKDSNLLDRMQKDDWTKEIVHVDTLYSK